MAAIDGAKVNFVYAQDSSHLPATLDANTVYFVPQSQTESGVLRVGSDIIATTDSSNIVITGSGSVVTGATWNNNTLTLTLGDVPAASASNAGLMSASDFSKLAGITAGAEPNQNAFGKMFVQKQDGATSTNLEFNATSTVDIFRTSYAGAFNVNQSTLGNKDWLTIDLRDATTTLHGAMSASDKTKLDGIATGAEANVQSNWNETTTTSDAYILNKPTALSDFTNDLAVATTSASGLMSATDKSALDGAVSDISDIQDFITDSVDPALEKLSNIEEGAEPNQNAFSAVDLDYYDNSGIRQTFTVYSQEPTDTYYEKYSSAFRLNVSGPKSSNTTIVDIDLKDATTTIHGAMSSTDKTKLDGINAGAEVNQNAFSNVAVSGQTTVEADAKTDTLTLVAGSNVTITTDATNDSITISAASAPAAPVTSVNTQTGAVVLDADDVGAIASSLKGANSGVAELDATGKVPTSQLPSFVDDVLEYATRSAFPATGEAGKIYIDLSTNLTYRWGGTEYVEISPSLALGTTSSTAFRGDYGNTAYTHATDSSRLTTATASGLYKVASTAEGHVASLTAVQKSDITDLGIPAQDTTYSAATTTTDGLMSATDKANLDQAVTDIESLADEVAGIEPGAEVNQNAYSNVTVLGADSSGSAYSRTYSAASKTDIFREAFGNAFIVSNTAGQGVNVAHIDIRDATTTMHGAMSTTDKTKLDGITVGAEPNVQSNWTETSSSSDAYILNKPTALSDFTNDLADATTSASGLMSATDKSKLNGIEAGAEVNDNSLTTLTLYNDADSQGEELFASIPLGSAPTLKLTAIGATSFTGYNSESTVVGGEFYTPYAFTDLYVDSTLAGSASEYPGELNLVSGSNVSLTYSTSSNMHTVTIDATDTTYSDATTTTDGLMSSADKTKLNGITAGAEPNQNAISNVTVGSVTISAVSATDTITLIAGNNVTLTPNATNKSVTITSAMPTWTVV